MSQTFYKQRRVKGRYVPARFPQEFIRDAGYGEIFLTKTILMSYFNPELGFALYKPPVVRTNLEWRMVEDIGPYIPEPLWAFFCAGTDGKWSREELAGFVTAFRNCENFVMENPIPLLKCGMGAAKMDNTYMRDPEWIGRAREFVDELDKWSKKYKYGVEWS